MPFRYDPEKCEIIVMSDPERDGMILEMMAHDPDTRTVMSAFYSDATGELFFSSYQRDLPVDLVKRFIAEARIRLPPSRAV